MRSQGRLDKSGQSLLGCTCLSPPRPGRTIFRVGLVWRCLGTQCDREPRASGVSGAPKVLGPRAPGALGPREPKTGVPGTKAPVLRGPRVQARCATRSRRRSDPGPPIDPRGLGGPCGQENKHPRVLCFRAGNRGSLKIGDPIVGEASPNRRFNKHGHLRGRSGGPNRRFNKHDHFRGRSGGPNRRFNKHGQFRGRSGGPSWRFNKHGHFRGRSGGPNRRFNKQGQFRSRSGGPNRRFNNHGHFRGRSGGPIRLNGQSG
jgi:hypothetical protein